VAQPKTVRRFLILSLLLAVCLAAGGTTAREPSTIELLDDYVAGRFDRVVETLAGDAKFDEILEQLQRDGPAWIDVGGPTARARRKLAAATWDREAARGGAWHEWKHIQKQPRMCDHTGKECYDPPNVLYWRPPPLLLEWGCELLRRHPTPQPIERWWQLAALAVAQRSEDPQFLIGDTSIGRGIAAGEVGNVQLEIKHLDHVTPRFPQEMRFVLAQGIARDRFWPDDAISVYRALEKDPDVAGEATMRLGAMQMRLAGRSLPAGPGGVPRGRSDPSDALKNLERAENLTRDPYVVFLARYFKAQIFERQRRPQETEAAYRSAVAAVPHAQSATVALAAIVFNDGRRAEAQQLVRDMLAAEPAPLDPWRAYVHADDRFWPQLIGRLRAEILK